MKLQEWRHLAIERGENIERLHTEIKWYEEYRAIISGHILAAKRGCQNCVWVVPMADIQRVLDVIDRHQRGMPQEIYDDNSVTVGYINKQHIKFFGPCITFTPSLRDHLIALMEQFCPGTLRDHLKWSRDKFFDL